MVKLIICSYTMSSRSSPLWRNTFFLQLLRRSTCKPPAATFYNYRAAASSFRHGYSMSRALQTFGGRGGDGDGGKWGSRMKLPSVTAAAGYGLPATPPPPPPRFNLFPGWARWVAGSVITLFLPTFWKSKWAELKRIEGEAEMVMEGVEHAAEVVEKVAMKAEKITGKVADKLPDGNKLKEAVLVVERFSKATADDAHLTTDIIHKVEALKEGAENLETLVEKVVHKEAESKGITK